MKSVVLTFRASFKLPSTEVTPDQRRRIERLQARLNRAREDQPIDGRMLNEICACLETFEGIVHRAREEKD